MTYDIVVYKKSPPIDEKKEQGIVIALYVDEKATYWGGTNAIMGLRKISKQEAERMLSEFNLSPWNGADSQDGDEP